ncbi:MAG TPA: bi-domain-containing oxidoreductase [Vicinamibacterales bacterium]|nr:bi-domain-containing oxidoreductase [Vicinamibacterales bacterium]
MKQLLQSSRTGATSVVDVPVPAVPSGFVLVRTIASLVSAGTERMMIQFAEKNLAQKAMARPDLVKQVLEKVSRDGLLTTLALVRERLDQPMALGYSAAGVVIAAGPDAAEFSPGDRVSCAGAGFANHAEVICVPKNLCVRVPDGVDWDAAVFATVGAIALHGVRLAELRLGERVTVIGLGLLGQLAVQLCRASGVRVFGIDPVKERRELALSLGADAAEHPDSATDAVRTWSGGIGVDASLITADASNNGPIELAGTICRDRGTVVAVGAVGMEVPRRTFFAKELKFLISRSYGPGRYDPEYELGGHDYPIGYVRWTERRNLAAFLDQVAVGGVDIAPMISHRFPIDRAGAAYELITGKTGEPFLGVVLTYPDEPVLARTIALRPAAPATAASPEARLAFLGAGGFATSTLLPAFKEAGGRMVGIVSRQGVSARASADRYQFEWCGTDEQRALTDPQVNAVVIATRHDLHARQALAAARAGKHVFVEKPLCLTDAELDELVAEFSRAGAPLLMVGFNRRFAPLAQKLAEHFTGAAEPLAIHYRVNAGFVPPDHWVQDPGVGGGRLIGEVCHFVDFSTWLARSVPQSVYVYTLPDSGRYRGDNMSVVIGYANGSNATITYVASGDKGLGKERVEVHAGGRSAVLQDFRKLETYHGGRRRVEQLRLKQDKGHRAECAAFVKAVTSGGTSPIPLEEIASTTRLTFRAVDSAREQRVIELR